VPTLNHTLASELNAMSNNCCTAKVRNYMSKQTSNRQSMFLSLNKHAEFMFTVSKIRVMNALRQSLIIMILDRNQVLLGTNEEVAISIEVSPSILVAVGVSLPQRDAPYLTTIPGIDCRHAVQGPLG